jgi:hypothetical protein
MDDASSRLIHTLYAGLSEPGWAQPFLEDLCRATGSHAGALVVSDLHHGRDVMPAFCGAQNASALDYERRYAGHNPWRQTHAHRPREAGSVVVSDDLVPFGELTRSFFWKDFLRHLDIDHGAGLVGVSSAQHLGSLSLLRSRVRGPYRDHDLALLQQVSAHWANACQLRARLGLLSDEEQTLAAALDHVGLAVFLLNGAGELIRTNAAGDALLRQAGVLWLRSGRPTARHGASALALAQAVEAVLAPNALPSALVPLHDATGRLAAQAGLHRMTLRPAGSAVRAVLLVQSLRPSRSASLHDALRMVYRLTVREAQLATHLDSGLDLGEAAAAIGITTEHARTRFKVLSQKLGVNSRSEALRLMEALGSALGRPSP